MDNYLSLFIEMLQAKNLTANTIRNYQTYIKLYLSYLQDRNLSPDQVARDFVRAFLRELQASRQLSDRSLTIPKHASPAPSFMPQA